MQPATQPLTESPTARPLPQVLDRNAPPVLERISIEVTNRCSKACWFCYNHSSPAGATHWTPDELVAFVSDCAAHGVKAVSFGGGEPLQYDGLFELLDRLRGLLFRSITSNGLLLDAATLERLAAAAPDKVHVSIHFPDRCTEVERVIGNVHELTNHGIRSGVNLVVARSKLEAARSAALALHGAGIGHDRIVYLPMRGQDTPTPQELARVAGCRSFQSMTCLLACGPSPRFCSIRWDRTVAWCSYTTTRRVLPELTYRGLTSCLTGLGLEFCGGTDGH
jgi:sulfatase maturation enzyme AslB (radical SAM superfamily)